MYYRIRIYVEGIKYKEILNCSFRKNKHRIRIWCRFPEYLSIARGTFVFILRI